MENKMIGVMQIERDFSRILNSKRSLIAKTKMVDRLCQKINEHHTSLPDDSARSRFRSEYRTLVETKFPKSTSDAQTNRARLSELILDHACKLKEVEEMQENLNRKLGDF
jgi:hypothetical protein